MAGRFQHQRPDRDAVAAETQRCVVEAGTPRNRRRRHRCAPNTDSKVADPSCTYISSSPAALRYSSLLRSASTQQIVTLALPSSTWRPVTGSPPAASRGACKCHGSSGSLELSGPVGVPRLHPGDGTRGVAVVEQARRAVETLLAHQLLGQAMPVGARCQMWRFRGTSPTRM